MACANLCVPGKADLALTFPPSAGEIGRVSRLEGDAIDGGARPGAEAGAASLEDFGARSTWRRVRRRGPDWSARSGRPCSSRSS
ncbi:MAG: hypothetical protein M0C28_23325 [Candidatus Moduliflexus flocculans]|nr:hypothetical protein [Candidatus Moduliflexus flocculans]